MQKFIADNAPSWYKYINGTLGRSMANGELYIITGAEKTIAGGVATFQNIPLQQTFQLEFKKVEECVSRPL